MPLVKMSRSKLGTKAAIKYEDDDAKTQAEQAPSY